MADEAVMIAPNQTSAVIRQAGVLIAIAASVALGVYVVMWAKAPNFSLLYSDLADRDVAQIADALKATDIAYRIDPDSGAVMVASSRVHDARMKLAAAGLPKSTGIGFEMLDEDAGFGTSQFIEKARYQRAMEGELSRSISRINNVRSARVHLGVPKQTVFARANKQPTASVIVDLYAGRRLEPGQVNAIMHLVSASVPNLPPDRVTVIDQLGNLLTDQTGNNDIVLTGRRFEYRQRLESAYIDRIESILIPFVGADGVRAQVTADLDFTTTEQTRESFNPDLPAIRSERLMEEQRSGNASVGGVPGALSNEPPTGATAPEQTLAEGEGADAGGEAIAAETAASPQSTRSQTTRNYELDRTISHTKPSVGTIRRLSVAVVLRKPAGAESAVEAEAATAEDGSEETPVADGNDFSEEQFATMTKLVKEAIGFNPARGDTVSVTSAEFVAPPAPEPLPEVPIWQQPWVWDVAKQVAGAVFVLLVVFGVIRPATKSLINRPTIVDGTVALNADGTMAALPAAVDSGGGGGNTEEEEERPMIQGPELPRDVDGVRQYVNKEPKIAAQVVRGWVSDD